MLFYAFDQIMYVSTRDFYEPYEEIVPGRIIKRFDQLMEAIEKEDYNTDKIDWFIKKNFTYTDGKATDRVIDLIIGKDTKKMSAVSMKGALAAVSCNFESQGNRKEKHYNEGGRDVPDNRESAGREDDENDSDKYLE